MSNDSPQSVPAIRDHVGACRPARVDGDLPVDETNGIHLSISALIQAEREHRLQHILDSAPIGIVSLSSEGRILSVNREAEVMFGYAAKEICGKPLEILISSEQRCSHEVQMKHFIAGSTDAMPMSNWRHVKGIHKSGRAIPLQVVVEKSQVNGERLATAIIRDMSEIAERDTRLEQITAQNIRNGELADVARRARRDFMAIMSHELRTPLNAIIGFSDLLLNPPYGTLTEETRKEYARDINMSGKQLLTLINGILELTRIESGRIELQQDEVDFIDVIHGVVAGMAPELEANQIDLTLPPAGQKAVFIADVDGVRRVLEHLLSNAAKFTRVGGHVMVQVSEIEDGRMVQVKISDDGIGISQEDLPRLCQPFEQVEGCLARSHGGVGIGLATVRSLVNAMNGSLKIDSDTGRGTTVSFAFKRTCSELRSSSRWA